MINLARHPDTAADREMKQCLDAAPPTSFTMTAGAGSGKTTSLVNAIDHIRHTRGAEMRGQGQQVACITYTEVAAAEISGRLANDALVHVSTIHSFLWSLVRPFQKNIAEWVSHRLEEKLVEIQQESEAFTKRTHQSTRDRNSRDAAALQDQQARLSEVRRFTYGTGSDYSHGTLGHDDIIKMVPNLISERPLLADLLSRKYPYFLVDESQDTFAPVVEALRVVAEGAERSFCLGFFGDPMQQIYMSGVGGIVPSPNWKLITKPENFRCAAKVLSLINRIRESGDGIQQTHGRHETIDGERRPVAGSASLFVLPADEDRSTNLERVRTFLAREHSAPEWLSDDDPERLRILVIVHRMAAGRLGFSGLYSAFNDKVPASFSDGFREGTLWALKPFVDFLQPLSQAVEHNRHYEVMRLLRLYCPRLAPEVVKSEPEPATLLASLKTDVEDVARMLSDTCTETVLEVLAFADNRRLIALDSRLRRYMDPDLQGDLHSEEAVANMPDVESAKEANAIAAYLACPAREVKGYFKYINDLSPYSTHQGIKGAEFDRVLVIVDDEEGRHFQFSYDKLFGLKGPSVTDLKNREDGKETVIDRTRRLFYVCCSRAKIDLAVVLYTQDVEEATARLREATMFERAAIRNLADLG